VFRAPSVALTPTFLFADLADLLGLLRDGCYVGDGLLLLPPPLTVSQIIVIR
jgi:hypothetical protein